MSALLARKCCCGPGDDCCGVASSSWANKYCFSVGEMFFQSSSCSEECEDFQYDCGEPCNQGRAYCCITTTFNWCVRGAIFRVPRTLSTDPFCDPIQLDTVYEDSLCPNPWSPPNWNATEGGENSYYSSPRVPLTGGYSPNPPQRCTTAPNWARVRYRCRYAQQVMAGAPYDQGLACGDFQPFDDYYVVEGVAEMHCFSGTCEDLLLDYGLGLCDCGDGPWQSPMHVLVISPIETPPTGLLSPPTMVFAARLGPNDSPDSASWTLLGVGLVGFSDPCNPSPGSDFDEPTQSVPGSQTCRTYSSGDVFNLGAQLVVSAGDCSDNLCVLT